MSSKSDKDRLKAQQEKHQAILAQLLKDDDNKYCVDCDAKGPRWASWNLGIFLCIRCAGIHRNLGVHISKVKSVNLDSWSAEQLGMILEMGNSRARAVYEANIPDNFRRPQTDSPLESFIRAKYEHKKYIAKEWVPPEPKIPRELTEDKSEKKKAKLRPTGGITLNAASSRPKPNSSISNTSNGIPKTTDSKSPEAAKPANANPSQGRTAASDLLSLDSPKTAKPSNADLLDDLLGGGQQSTSTSGQQQPGQNQQNGTFEEPLFGDGVDAGKPSTKDSILALYGPSAGQQQQMYGVPGAVPQQQYQQQMGQYNYYYDTGAVPQQQYQQQMGQYNYYYDTGGVYLPQQQQAGMGMYGGGMNMMGGAGMPAMAGNNMQYPGMMQQQQHPGMYGGMQGQQAIGGNMMPGGGMMAGGMGGGAGHGMASGVTAGGGMMAGGMAPHGHMGAMYGQPQMNQLQYQQMQQQMAAMKVGNAGAGMPQQSAMGVNRGWNAGVGGQTLSNNLWQ